MEPKKDYIKDLLLHETKQMEKSTQALMGLAILIVEEKLKHNHSYVLEVLNKYRKVNIELTDVIIYISKNH